MLIFAFHFRSRGRRETERAAQLRGVRGLDFAVGHGTKGHGDLGIPGFDTLFWNTVMFTRDRSTVSFS